MYFSCMPAFSFTPENGRGLSNSSSLPVSPPGFPASNLGSKAKGRMGKIKVFPTPEYGSKQPRGAPGTMRRHLPQPQQVRQNRGADQPGPRQKVHRAGQRAGLLGGLGRGGAAGHHPEAAQDHRDVQEVGDEETVSGADHPRRPSGYAAIAQTQRPGHTLHTRPAHANQHLGESQKLRLISAAVRVNQQFLCCCQHELDAVALLGQAGNPGL